MKKFALSVIASSLLFSYSIDSGYDDYFVVTDYNTTYVKGNNDYGELGIGNTYDKYSFTKLDFNFTKISAGRYHSLALNKDGNVYAWGYNYYGQLGDGTETNKNTPIKIGLSNIVQISAGGYHSLALNKDGNVYAWGYNSYGELGDGTETHKHNPTKINLSNIVQVSAGKYFSLALDKNGNVYAWGHNYYGELGDGNTSEEVEPAKTNLSNIVQISAGGFHSLALDKEGKVYVWGRNNYGQLGIGTSDDNSHSTPIELNLSNVDGKVIKVVAAWNHSMLLTNTGKVYAWGYNYDGEVGNGNGGYGEKVLTPTLVKLNKKVIDIAGDKYTSMAITKDGFIYTWGNYSNGSYDSYVPIKQNINVYIFKTLINNKKFKFYEYPKSGVNNYYEDIVEINNSKVTLKRYYPNGDLIDEYNSTLKTQDDSTLYFDINGNRYWIYKDNNYNIFINKTLTNQLLSVVDPKKAIQITKFYDLNVSDNKIINPYIVNKLKTIDSGGTKVEKLIKDNNKLYMLDNNGNIYIYDVSNEYTPIYENSIKIDVNASNGYPFNSYNMLKEGDNLYVVGYKYNGNYYETYLVNYNLKTNKQINIKLNNNDCSNVGIAYNNGTVYVLDGDNEKLFVIKDNQLVATKDLSKDANGNYLNPRNRLIYKNGKLFVANYDDDNVYLVIDVSNLNNIAVSKKSVKFDKCCEYGNYILKDNNDNLYIVGNNDLIKIDENGAINKWSGFDSQVAYIKNKLALTKNGSLYQLNDDNTTIKLTSGNLNIYSSKDIVFVNDNDFYYVNKKNYNDYYLNLGSLKAYDEDFDGVYDFEDLYPKDASKFFKDSDGDGLVDSLNPNTSFNDGIYKNVQFDPDFFNLETNLSNIIEGNYDYYWDSSNKTDGKANLIIEDVNGTKYTLVTSLFDVYSINNDIYTENKTNYYEVYPQKTTEDTIILESSKIPDKKIAKNVILLNTNGKQSVSDAAKDMNVSEEITDGDVYSGDLYYDVDVQNSGHTWFKISANSNGNYEDYTFIIKPDTYSKFDEDKDANATFTIYKTLDYNFTELSGDFAYEDTYGYKYYINENGNSYSLNDNNEYEYYDNDNYKYVDVNISQNKFLKDGFYKYNGTLYYVNNGVRYYLYVNTDYNNNVKYYYYYDKNNKQIKLYPKIEPIGQKEFPIDKMFKFNMALNRSKTYYFKLSVDKNTEDFQYLLSLVKNNTYYSGTVTLDENGSSSLDLVLPKSKTYKFIFASQNKIDVNLTDYEMENRVKAVITNKDYFVNKDLGLKAGAYSLYFKGKANSKVTYTIVDSNVNLEQEPDDTRDKAVNYYGITQGVISSKSDVDFYGFKLGNSYSYYGDTYNVNITISSKDFNTSDKKDKIYLYLYNTQDLEALYKKIIYAKKEVEDNKAKVEFTGIPSGVYYVKLQRAGGKVPFEYNITISNSDYYSDYIHPLPTNIEENIYEKKYYDFIANNSFSLDKVATEKGDKGEAIILTGLGDEPSDPLFKPSQILAASMYKTFKLRGLSDKDIYYIDADNKGTINNVDLKEAVDDTNASVKTFLNTIKEAQNSSKEGPLYIYMVDHGAPGAFKISSKDVDGDGKPEIVYASELKKALDKFQEDTGRSVVLIIEACHSGSFINKLKGNNRVIVTSSQGNQLSYIDPTGVAFSRFLAMRLLSGQDIEDAYKFAKSDLYNAGDIYKNQNPDIYPSINDKLTSGSMNNLLSLKIGGNFAAASMEVLSIDDYYGKNANEQKLDLSNTDKLSLYEKVSSAAPVNNAWAVVIPPNYVAPTANDGNFTTPDLSKYTVYLKYDKTSKEYKGDFNLTGYKYNGTFSISYYVEDGDGNIISKSVEINATGGKDFNKSTVVKDETNEIKENGTIINNETNITSGNGETINVEKNVTTINNKEVSIKVGTGWNMIDIPSDIEDISDINVKIIWKYENGQWEAYSNNSDILNKIENYNIPIMYSLNAGDGVWIYADVSKILKFTNPVTTTVDLNDLSKGWDLVGIEKNTDLETIPSNVKIIWSWDNQNSKWEAYSANKELNATLQTYYSKGIFEQINKLKTNKAYWFLVK